MSTFRNNSGKLHLPVSLDDLLQGGAVEWERLEYKRGWNPEDVLNTLCAFANDFHNLGGGYLLLGVEENEGRPVLPPIGLRPDQLDRIQKDLLNLCQTVQMNLVGGPSERAFPKNVGLLFFHDSPSSFFPATQIDVVYFPDGTGGDQFTEKTFKGPLSRMVRDALDYVQRNFLIESVRKQTDRPEAERVWNFPYAAIEEAVVNAVYHRSYEIREPVEIRITPDELVVLSFPGPDRPFVWRIFRRAAQSADAIGTVESVNFSGNSN